MNRRQRRAASQKPENSSFNSTSIRPDSLYETGVGHARAGRYLDAQICCQQALAIDGNHADTLHLVGVLALQAEQYDHAVEWIARAIRQAPKGEYLLTLGITLRRQGRRDEALKTFEKAVELKPDEAGLYQNIGEILLEMGRPNEAVLRFQRALELKPDHWDAANKCAVILVSLGRLEDALRYLNLCDALRPNHFPTLHMQSICLCSLNGFEEALPGIERARALAPDNAEICYNVGTVLQSFSRDEEALGWLDRALELQPRYVNALHNKAVALTKTHRFQEAFAIYDGLKAIDPNDVLADLGRAHLQLLTGDYEAGWAAREARWALPSRYPRFAKPMWLGNDALDGKTILVRADEGFGDTIQFVRYVPRLAEQGARVVMVVQDQLHALLANLSGVSQCIPISRSAALPAFDLHCPMMSLPFAFRTTLGNIPAPTSYLPCPTEAHVQAWERRLGRRAKLRVGLVWSGNPRQPDDHNRSLSLLALSRITDVDATFVSLQKDPKPADRVILLERSDIVDLTHDLTDFNETAALVSCLDLVISVDTSVAHLAAALGRPTWVLLSHTPDWRWLLGRDDSPWYPTARLFRQDKTRDYGKVLDRVRIELAALAANGPPFRPPS